MGNLWKYYRHFPFYLMGLVFIVCLVPLQAQYQDFFRHIGKEDGLSQGSVFAITQDADGYIWMGTRDGLNKYDGSRFTVYRNNFERNGTINGNDIRVLYYDTVQSALWVGTFDGLSRYNAMVDTFHNYTEDDGLVSNLIRCIFRDSENRLWIGSDKGLNLYRAKEGDFISIPVRTTESNETGVNALCEDQFGNLLVGSTHGVYRLSGKVPEQCKFESILAEIFDTKESSDYNVQALLKDDLGRIWVGTEDGVLRINENNDEVKHYNFNNDDPFSLSNNNVRSIAKSPDGSIWIGTLVGLNKYIIEADHFIHFEREDLNPHSLSNSSIRSVFFDQTGGLWVGTYHGGVNYGNPALSRFQHFEHLPNQNSISSNVVSSFVEDKNGNFWIGTEGGGLNYFNTQTGRFNAFLSSPGQSNRISGNNVKTLLIDGDKLWIGTFRYGISCLNLSDMKFQQFKHEIDNPHSISNNNVYSLLKENNKLWIVTYGGGLSVFNLETQRFNHFKNHPLDTHSISSNNGRVIIKDSRHQLWIGTENGLNLVLRDSINDIDLSFKRFLDGHKIYSLFEDKSGLIWIGSFSNGLFSYNPYSKQFKQYTESQGLPGRTIFGILQDNFDHLWLSTNNGLSKLDVRAERFTNYNHSNGLQNQEFNFNAHYKSSSGALLFGGNRGFTIFNPEEILPNRFIPPLVFTDLKVYHKKVDLMDENSILDKVINQSSKITFDYNEAIFSIGIAALDYYNPSNIQYAYQLEGLDNDWNHTVGQTEASYTIQRPGTYTFRVKAANSDGLWSKEERQLQIIVKPPPWLTAWAYLIYFLLFAGAIYGIWFFIRLRNRLQREQFAKEQQKKLNEMKLRFFTDITHEFRTPLTLIMGPLEELAQRYASNGTQNHFQSIKRNTQRLLNLVNQILTFRKLESNNQSIRAAKGDMVRFIKQVFNYFEDAARIRGIDYFFRCEDEEILMWFDYEKLENVFFNLLSNAFKFTPDRGIITIEVINHRDSVRVVVSDNGNGIKKELYEQIFKRYYEKVAVSSSIVRGSGIGLALSKEMVELHHGKLWVESEVGKGSKFYVQIPLGNSHLAPSEILDIEIPYQSVLVNVNNPVAKTPDFSWLEETPDKSDAGAPLVLIVEDNEEVLQYITSIFEPFYQIQTATNGLEGLKKATELNPEVIISDIMMPELDGIAMCEKLKSEVQTSHIPIILLTARSAQIFKNEGLEIGADDYVTKPFNPSELRLRVKNIIDTRQKMRQKFVRVINLEPKEITVTSADEDFLQRALEIAEKHINNSNFTTDQFAYELAVSRPLLFTKMKALTNQTPNNFIKTLRIKRAAQLLKTQKLNIAEVAYKVGFRDSRYFSKCFQKQYKQTPSEFMNSF